MNYFLLELDRFFGAKLFSIKVKTLSETMEQNRVRFEEKIAKEKIDEAYEKNTAIKNLF